MDEIPPNASVFTRVEKLQDMREPVNGRYRIIPRGQYPLGFKQWL